MTSKADYLKQRYVQLDRLRHIETHYFKLVIKTASVWTSKRRKTFF